MYTSIIRSYLKTTIGQDSLKGGSITLADDHAASITPSNTSGILVISSETSTIPSIIAFGSIASPYSTLLATGSIIEVATGPLAGTTGTDGKYTISSHTDGKLYFENRSGGAVTIGYAILAGI